MSCRALIRFLTASALTLIAVLDVPHSRRNRYFTMKGPCRGSNVGFRVAKRFVTNDQQRKEDQGRVSSRLDTRTKLIKDTVYAPTDYV